MKKIREQVSEWPVTDSTRVPIRSARIGSAFVHSEERRQRVRHARKAYAFPNYISNSEKVQRVLRADFVSNLEGFLETQSLHSLWIVFSLFALFASFRNRRRSPPERAVLGAEKDPTIFSVEKSRTFFSESGRSFATGDTL
ncbi:MAG: hypothetical protein ACLQAT_04625 [Candidatus Binataceae bacterium]